MQQALGHAWWGWAACAALFALVGAEAGLVVFLLLLLAPLGLATAIAAWATRRGVYPPWLTPVAAWVLGAGPLLALLFVGRGGPPVPGGHLTLALGMHRGPLAIWLESSTTATPAAYVVVPCLAIAIVGVVVWSVRRPGPGWVVALAPSIHLWCIWGAAIPAIDA